MINENITPEMVPDIHNKATTVAKTAVADWLADWNAKTGGNEYGEPMYCGFAWVELPSMKLSTKLGKAFAAVGFKKSYRRGLTLWNPGDHHGQSMDCKEIGADAYANVLESYGIQAYGASRADQGLTNLQFGAMLQIIDDRQEYWPLVADPNKRGGATPNRPKSKERNIMVDKQIFWCYYIVNNANREGK